MFFDVRREAQSFSPDFYTCPKPRATPAARPWRAPKVNSLLRTLKFDSTDFFSNPQNPPRTLPVHDVIHIPRSYFLSGVSIVTSLNDTSAPHAREHLRSCLHLTNPCAKRKVLSLTKPKGKIYKRNPSAIILHRKPHEKAKQDTLGGGKNGLRLLVDWF